MKAISDLKLHVLKIAHEQKAQKYVQSHVRHSSLINGLVEDPHEEAKLLEAQKWQPSSDKYNGGEEHRLLLTDMPQSNKIMTDSNDRK